MNFEIHCNLHSATGILYNECNLFGMSANGFLVPVPVNLVAA